MSRAVAQISTKGGVLAPLDVTQFFQRIYVYMLINSSFPPDKAVPILEQLVSDADALLKEHRDSTKRQKWQSTAQAALERALGLGNPATLAFVQADCGFSSFYDTEDTRQQRANERLRDMVAAVSSGIQQLRWELPDPTQTFLPAGSEHDAYVKIREILALVSQNVVIVDNWVDGTLWTLLTNVPASSEIRVMTMQMKPYFSLEGKKFVTQHGNKVEVRTTMNYHDRFILVDGAKCWHLGASIKDAGRKAFALSEVVSLSIAAAIRTDVESTWTSATPVPL
jgi:hypothetical protein